MDRSVPNGSSIALLAEYDGHRLLLTGDAYAPDLLAGLARLNAERGTQGPLALDAFKLAHHGSANNLSRELVEAVDCARYLVSTDGSVHRHPDHQALLTVLRYSRRYPCLAFNHEALTTRDWRDKRQDVTDAGFPSYDTAYPAEAARGFVLRLS